MAYPKAFMETLGEYQYGYWPGGIFDTTIKGKYVGKGRNTRCLEHLANKDVVVEDLVIIGRNLEKFTKGKDAIDAVQFAVESLMINVLDPTLNKVKGRYDETWCKAPLTELYTEWKKEQIDPVKESMRFYNEHPEIHDNVKGMWATGNAFVYTSPTNNGIEYLLSVVPDVDGFIPTVKVKFASSKREELRDQWIKDHGTEYTLTQDGEMVSVQNLTVDKAIELWLS